MNGPRRAPAALAALVAALISGARADGRLLDRADVISLGRSASGEPCVASRNWRDSAVSDPFARAYTISCRGVAASRAVGVIRVIPDTPEARKPIEATLACGVDSAVTIAGGAGRARRCFDQTLGLEVVRLDLFAGRERVIADAAPAFLAELEEGAAVMAGARRPSADAGRTVTAVIDPTRLAPAPIAGAAPMTLAVSDSYDPAAALNQGISLNHKGLDVDASRVLNDALSRLPAITPPAERAELLLETGLADSNIHFADAAGQHFDEADAIFTANPAARTSFLLRKRDTYRALDLINRHEYAAALAILDRLARATAPVGQPLQDPATLRQLNQPVAPRTAAVRSIGVADTANLSRLALDAEIAWARSVALLSLGDKPGALVAINAAASAYRPLQTERIDRAKILWLGARIERQRARLLVGRGEIASALDDFDRAADSLRRGALATAGTGTEPAIADAEMERAAVFARSGASHAAIRDSYARAVDAAIDAKAASLGNTAAIEGYLDLLVGEARRGVTGDTAERFFRAMQASGEPAVARQVNQLQAVVAADPAMAVAFRDRAELERDVTRLRYAIAAVPQPGQPAAAELEGQRALAEARLLRVDAVLASDPKFRAVDDRPATLAELRAALRPGEVFLKVTQTGTRIYGLFVSRTRTNVYAIAPDARTRAVVDQLAVDVRASIDGRLDAGQLAPFDDAKAYALFRLVAGPAADALASARALVVDPAGPLERLPVGVLVTRYGHFIQRLTPFDFTQVAFLAAHTAVSTALSPRSFLVSRALPPSHAPHPFLGLGEHVPATVPPGGAGRLVQVGYGCSVRFGELAALSRQLKPISRHELVTAADALGDPSAPMITDAAFSDTEVEARDDLGQFQVLHFATHGLQEGQWGCSQSPPALVASFGTGNSDGLLSFSEIAELRLDANLVVLSACDTASGVNEGGLARLSGQEEAGSSLEGLVRAFLAANARAVMATYWQVSAERDSDEFVHSFYTAARGQPIAVALRNAQLALIRQPAYSHPFFWAPYFVVGDGGKYALGRPILQQVQQVATR